jgi:hypothetical protein
VIARSKHFGRRRSSVLRILVGLLAILAVECALFNHAFWEGIAASTDSDAAQNTFGAGLARTDSGLLKVTDPTRAYLELGADGTSSFARIDPLVLHSSQSEGRRGLDRVQVRLDCDGYAGRVQTIDLRTPRSLYVRADARSTVRLWIQEPAGSLIPIQAVRANVRVPFQFDWLRVAAMAALLLLFVCWRPGSSWWRTELDPASPYQRALLAVMAAAVLAVAGIGVAQQLQMTKPLDFHASGAYTYDFDQYGHLADSLLHGRLSLDLPVPDALAKAADPYSTVTRERLLARGVSPIYWDYAFYQGHWYSYFGVLPALALFLPYRALSSLWVPGGMMLPASAAVLLLSAAFIVFGSLLAIRLVRRVAPHASLAAASMSVTLLLIGSNIAYLMLRRNFYSVPFAASLLISALGLWFWLGSTPQATKASRQHRGDMVQGRRTHAVWHIGNAPAVSLPRLAAGSLCISANIGCRPTFTLVALLGFPIFARQLAALGVSLRHRITMYRAGSARGSSSRVTAPRTAKQIVAEPETVVRNPVPGGRGSLRAAAVVALPALLMVVPIGIYNALRFGSPFDFGEGYQLTVTDMTRYAPSSSNIIAIIGYSLFLPWRFVHSFPFLAIAPAPLAQWAYVEPMAGGLFMLCPTLLLIWALPMLWRRLQGSRLWGFLAGCLMLGLVLTLVDAARGGLGWRYMSDYGWLFSLGAIGAMLAILRETDREGASRGLGDTAATPSMRTSASAASIALWCVRAFTMTLMLVSIAIAVLSLFVPGRDDALIRTDPVLYYTVRSWFALL